MSPAAADSDGLHIATLLSALFLRQFPSGPKRKTPRSAGFPGLLRDLAPGYSPSATLISTRRFFALFSALSFGTIGLVSPNHSTTIWALSMPFPLS